MTIRYGEIGRDSRHLVSVLGDSPARVGSGVSSINMPFATTFRTIGALTIHVTVAFSDG
jgi:hypothetical protein